MNQSSYLYFYLFHTINLHVYFTYFFFFRIADVLLEFRSILWNVVYFILRYEGKDDYEDKLHLIRPFRKVLMDLVSELLTESSRHIDDNIENDIESNAENDVKN